MKDRLFNTIIRYFPEEFFAVNERREKIGAFFYDVRDRDTDGKNLHASFFIYETEPDAISIDINNVMAKAHIDDCGDVILKTLNDAIELREQYLKISGGQKKLIELEQIRKGEPIKEVLPEEKLG